MREYSLLSCFLSKNNYSLTDIQRRQFDRYYEMLVDKNKVMNLTAITDFDEVEEKHFLDSAAVIEVLDMTKVNSVIDVGTGAGFPGVPLKILFPHLNVLLADSLRKRVDFLNEVISQLELENINAVHGRAEELGRNKEYRESFDLCVSRAVAKVSVLSELCIPFVKRNGFFIPYKAGNSEDEINEGLNAVKILGGSLNEVKSIVIGNSALSRTFPVIKKINTTSLKFPRKPGTPSKDPL